MIDNTGKSIELIEENLKYYNGDTFDYWIGAAPDRNGKDAVRIWAEIEKAFQNANFTGEVVDRHRRALTSKDPLWYFVDEEGGKLTDNQDATAATLQLDGIIANVQQQFTNPFTTFWKNGLVGGWGYLRVFVPEARVNDPDPLKRIAIHSPKAESVEVVRDANELVKSIKYFFMVADAEGNQSERVELQQLTPTGKTLFRIEDADGNLIDNLEFELDLGGRFTIWEMRREPLITESIKRAQNAINHCLTMMPRNIEYSGFIRELILNGEPPGDFVIDETTGKERFVPTPLEAGAGISTFVEGKPIYGADGKISGYSTPSVVKHDPVDTETFIKTSRSFAANIYQNVGQGHILATDALLSGISRVQMRQDFILMVNEDVKTYEVVLSNIFMVALLLANQNRVDTIKALRLTVKVRPAISTALPEEIKAIIDLYKSGLLSRSTALALCGYVDAVDDEIALIDAERTPVPPNPFSEGSNGNGNGKSKLPKPSELV